MNMHIIHIAHGKANPDRMNGVGVSIHNIASGQVAEGLEVQFWGFTKHPYEHNYPPRGFKTLLFPQLKNPFSLPADFEKHLAEQPTGTVFHLHGGLLPLVWAVARKLQKAGFQYVYTPHGSFMDGAFQKNTFAKTVYLHVFERRLMARAAAVMMLGQGEVDFIKKRFPEVKLKLVPNGFDPLTTSAELEKKPGTGDPIFAFCGRLDRHHKGLDILLDGFAKYRLLGGLGKLRIIGGGADEAFLKNKTAELRLGDAVEFTGPLFGAAKLAALREAGAFVHSSRMEGFPMAVLEAAALGLPLVVSEFTNFGDYVRDWRAGWVLPENTPDALADVFRNIEKMRQTGRLLAIAQNALHMVEGRFSCRNIAREVTAVYPSEIKISRPTGLATA